MAVNYSILIGDCRDTLKTLPDESVHCVVTSPPYYGLRDYGVDGQLGLEKSPTEFIAGMMLVFNEVWRVLRKDGTLWLNIGDSYASGGRGGGGSFMDERSDGAWKGRSAVTGWRAPPKGLKHKDLVGIPWRLAFALQDAGWYLRQDIIWSKPNAMPESVTDRCTKAHEYLFLLSKSSRYYYNNDAIKEPVACAANTSRDRWNREATLIPGQKPQKRTSRSGNIERKPGSERGCPEGTGANLNGSVPWEGEERNKRSVWSVPTVSYSGAHFATFPPALIVPCILAGCPEGGTVIDPFGGVGTTAGVANVLGRNAILCELNQKYADLVPARVKQIHADLLHLRQQDLLREVV